ncbi:D-2-hydroxyacid dehydrogenase family protein [Pedobacter sp. L105]|uniref:D-2-hydroxyacid dehydrogenase family protein n=1 Tax=Pedobacter sp. L105 TaxID=1641871 RepID=UPI00131A921B|nr:D-2-hydroxyacid dehydrogenase family protein [Pedobacter sp. L105]
MMKKIKIAILDDYQNAALTLADWSVVEAAADITVFNDHLSEEEEIAKRLQPFEIICVMRERTPLQESLLAKLPNVKLIVSTGSRNASIDLKATEKLGIKVANTGYMSTGAIEMTWAVLMAMARHIPKETSTFKSGGWQTTIGTDLAGKTIGIVGLGGIGKKIAEIAKVFDMNVIAWSQNLTPEKAAEQGARYVSKEALFQESDFITIHLVLSDRSRGIVSTKELTLMKPSAYFINTSRGPLVDEQALIEVLTNKSIAGAALDVFDTEPLPADHPFRKLDNLLATSHIGFVTEDTYRVFYGDTVKTIEDWLK